MPPLEPPPAGRRYRKEIEFHDQAYTEQTRARMVGFYAIGQFAKAYYRRLLEIHRPAGRVLEYGCGDSSHALRLAEQGAALIGIDISGVAVERARQGAAQKGVRPSFVVMNAEQLGFRDSSFELICGAAILHHLDLRAAWPEIARILTPGGTAIFVEPLGHNPLLNLFRKLTPGLRTADEHPLLIEDLRTTSQYFSHLQTRYFQLVSLLCAPLSRWPGFTALLRTCEGLDRAVFALLPFMRRFAWQVVLVLTGPKPAAAPPAHSTASVAKTPRSSR